MQARSRKSLHSSRKLLDSLPRRSSPQLSCPRKRGRLPMSRPITPLTLAPDQRGPTPTQEPHTSPGESRCLRLRQPPLAPPKDARRQQRLQAPPGTTRGPRVQREPGGQSRSSATHAPAGSCAAPWYFACIISALIAANCLSISGSPRAFRISSWSENAWNIA